jgi:hypothetical protein
MYGNLLRIISGKERLDSVISLLTKVSFIFLGYLFI